ncbi:hypothetical protein KKE14_01520 [Patescibacteria group bacterium]|nr:hypothetical protein [Patescibacteria group bacterium]
MKIQLQRLKQLNYRDWIAIILLSILTIAVVSRAHNDPDLGWHLRNGQDILKYGAPQGDYYSYTMSGYPWISHEWLTDIGLYLGSHYLGFVWLSFIFAMIVYGAYLIAARVSSIPWTTSLLTTLIAALVAMPVFGIRPQMITLLGIALTMWLLFRWRSRPQSNLIFWLIPVFLIWVNLHGGFAAGLFLIALFWFIELCKLISRQRFIADIVLSKSHLIKLAVVGCLSGVVTLVNPYTWRVYEELFHTLSNDLVKRGISEWTQVDLAQSAGYNLLVFAILIVVLLIFSWRKVDKTKVVIALVFFFISLSSWRHLPLFSLTALPLFSEMINALMPKGMVSYLRSNIMLIALGLVAVATVFSGYRSIIKLDSNDKLFGQTGKYPYGAVEYLKQHPIQGNMFNEYNWGGYLIWKLPTKRVFIDGRMAIWTTPEQNIFKDYLLLGQNDQQTTDILEKYDINFALVYKSRTFKDYYIRHSEQWELAYGDNLAMIFIKKNNTLLK